MASNSKKRRRVLGASCILAALIIASSSFAWFTSKDEVTNRLSAAANYGVAIAEDFQPPEKFLPGQTVNKDVGAVNTGNVDAFVRMWLGGQMRVVKETSAGDKVDAKTGATTTGEGALTAVTDESKKSVGLNYYNATTQKYYKTLSTDKIDNPKDLAHKTDASEETNIPATFSEVQAVQAGGVLVYAPVGAKYHWNLEQATELPVYDSTAALGKKVTMTNLPKGTVVGNSLTEETGATKLAPAGVTASTDAVTDSNYYGDIDASTFKPETTGLYIFRRNIAETADGTVNNYEYTGYYYDATKDVYFALHTETGDNGKSDYVLPTGAITTPTSEPGKNAVLPVTPVTVKLFTATETVVETGTADTNLVWAYDSTNKKFTVTYEGATDNDTTGWNDDIVIDVNLANIGNGAEEWTAFGTDHKTTFYYNNDVEEGDTTTKLVDSVELNSATQKEAYLAFDFDLNVFMESKQVTLDEVGKEKTTPVNTWAATTAGTPATAVNTGAKPSGGEDAANYDPADSEIETVGWIALS